jgi:hypothetical protein
MTGPPSTPDIWTILSSLGTLGTAVAAIGGLGFVVYQLRQNSRSLQLQAFEGIFHDIRELDKIWIEKNCMTDMPLAEKKAWCASFFNTIEYLCFLINHRMVRQKELRDFFVVGLREWWKQFQSYRTQGWIIDTPEGFAEFKKLCENEAFTTV